MCDYVTVPDTMSFQSIRNIIHPRKLFLIDSLGAFLSAILLGLLLSRFANTFGIPQQVLYFLSFMAVLLSIYSFLCFIGNIHNWRPYMKSLAFANLIYVCLTIGLIYYSDQKLTVLGLLYFVLEMLVITTLAISELKTASIVPHLDKN